MSRVLNNLMELFGGVTGDPVGTIQIASSSLRLEMVNGFLFLIGLYGLVVFVPFLVLSWRAGKRSAVVVAVYLQLIGHTMFRGWTWLSWHSINEGWSFKWMAKFPVWEISSIIIAVAIVWLSTIMVRGTIAPRWGGWFGWIVPLGLAIIGALGLRAI